MTTRTTEEEAALADGLRPWTGHAAGLISRRLADARQHAAAGKMGDARERLGELALRLGGRAMADGSGLLADARAKFYRDAHDALRTDPAIHRHLAPDDAGERVARTMAVGRPGRDHAIEAARMTASAAQSLAVAAAAPAATRAAALSAWEARHRERITAWALGHLSDAQMAITQAVARIHVKPELQ